MVRSSCLILLIAVFPLSAQDNAATIAFIQKHRNADGAYRLTPKEAPSTLRATLSAIRAIKNFGGEVKDRNLLMNFVKSCHDTKSGGFADRAGDPPTVALTAVGLMAMAELDSREPGIVDQAIKYLSINAKTFEEQRIAAGGFEAAKQIPDAIDEWFKAIDKTRNADGTYGKGMDHARQTGSVVAMQLRLNKEISRGDRMNAIKLLKGSQRADGGYGSSERDGSDLETTYRIIRACYLLKIVPERRAAVLEFLVGCRNPDGGYGLFPKQPSSLSATYYVSSIRHFMEEIK
jgi:hypothetical protein